MLIDVRHNHNDVIIINNCNCLKVVDDGFLELYINEGTFNIICILVYIHTYNIKSKDFLMPQRVHA